MLTSNQHTPQDRFVSLEKYQIAKRKADLWDWLLNLFSNPSMNLTLKGCLVAERIEEDARVHLARSDGMVPLFLPTVAIQVGLSADTMGKHLKKIAEEGEGILRREVVNTYGEDNKVSKRVYFKLTRLAREFPQRLRMKEGCEKDHGGKRERKELKLPLCTTPGCTCNVVIRERTTQWICEECGVVIKSKGIQKVFLRALPDIDTQELPVTPLQLSDYAKKEN